MSEIQEQINTEPTPRFHKNSLNSKSETGNKVLEAFAQSQESSLGLSREHVFDQQKYISANL